MVVWIINPYGSLPSEGWQKYRSTMIAECLAEKGIEVHQFISNFEHRSKAFRTDRYQSYIQQANYNVHIIPSSRYSKHVSWKRALYERSFARNVIRHSKGLVAPQLVILAEPTICYYDILLKWIKQDLQAKILIDIIDIWPELFELVFPKKLSRIAKFLMMPLYYWRKRLYAQADALSAVSQDYLSIGRKLGCFSDELTDVVYWGYPTVPSNNANKLISSSLVDLIDSKDDGEVWGVYAGTLGENYDLFSLFKAVKLLENEQLNTKVKIIVAGDGPLKAACEAWSDNKFAFFIGRLDKYELSLLLSASDFAFSTYKGKSTVSMPIKAYDYFAHGLPLINSLNRELGLLVESNGLGINYLSEDVYSLKEAIIEIVNNDQKRQYYRDNCLNVASQFKEEIQYSKFYNLVMNTVNVH